MAPKKTTKPKAADSMTLAQAFQEAQMSIAKHRKCVDALQAHRAATDDVDAWDDEFFTFVACVLPVYKRELAAERLVEFVVSFATKHGGETDVDEAFLEKLCFRLLKLASHKEKSVRFRVVQLVGRIMNAMAQEQEVSDDLFDAVEEAMLERCRDKVPVVRAWALKGLFRLQNPQDGSCAITAELLRLMNEDTDKEVRMAAISTLEPSRHAIRALLLRCRDSSEQVRLHALKVLREKVEMRWLSISQRVHILENALLDRSAEVAGACAELLCGGWLRKACDNDVLALLRALDAPTNEKAAQKALDVLLCRDAQTRELVARAAKKQWDKVPTAAPKAAEDGAATEASKQPEAAMCLRALLEWCAGAPQSKNEGSKDEAMLEENQPELPKLCDALGKVAEAFESGADAVATRFGSVLSGACSLAQLAQASAYCDFANEAGRRALEDLACQLLRNPATPDEALPMIVNALEASCIGEMARFQRVLMEVISDVEDPLDGELGDAEAADASLEREQDIMFTEAKLVEIKAQYQLKVQEEDEQGAADLKMQFAKLEEKLKSLQSSGGKASPEVLLARESRCLKLSALLLQAPRLALDEHEVAHLPQRFIPALQSPQVELRELAVKCLGLHCQASPRVARQFFTVLAKALQHDTSQVQHAALRACLDLLLLHSPSAVVGAADDEDEAAADGAKPLKPFAAGAKAAHTHAADVAAAAADKGVPLVRTEDATAAQVGALVLPLLEQPSGALRTTAALGLCKLMHAGALTSASLLSKLLLVHFDGSAMTEPDPQARRDAMELSQSLAVFFTASGRASGVANALLPAVRSVLAADEGSRDADVSIEGLCTFVCSLLASDAQAAAAAGDENSSPAMATNAQLTCALACECLLDLSQGDSRAAKALPKAFQSIMLPTTIKGASSVGVKPLQTLKVLLAELAGAVDEKTSAKHAAKMLERVDDLLGKALKAQEKQEGEAAEEAEEGAEAAADDDKAHEKVAEGVLAAFKKLRAADAAAATAQRKAIDESKTLDDDDATDDRRASGGKGGGEAPGRRKLTGRSKTAGLTPAKGSRLQNNLLTSENGAGNIAIS